MLNLIAQKIENPQLIDSVRNLTSEGYINRLIPAIINILFIVSIVAFMFLLLIGGTQWILSGGNKQSLENARNKIINAITGLLILLLLWIIIKIINGAFGINLGNIGASSGGGGNSGSQTCASYCQGGDSSNFGPYYFCRDSGSSIPSYCNNDGTTDCTNPTRDCFCCNQPYVAPTAPPAGSEGARCLAAGGVWELLPSSCADICGCTNSLSVMTMGCNCATGCWQDPNCVNLSPPGANCTSSVQCQSGFCSNVNDLDGDGFYSESTSGICRSGVIDCNDNNNLVFPGQTQYFQDPIVGTSNDFNYDCADGDSNGDPNDKWPTWNCLSSLTDTISCQEGTPYTFSVGHQGWRGSIPVCGQDIISNLPWGPPTWEDCVSSTGLCSSGPGGGWFEMDCNYPTLCKTGNDPTSGLPIQSYHLEGIGFFSWMLTGYPTKMSCK